MIGQRRDPERFLARRRALDEVVVEKGDHAATPPRWWATHEKFFRSGARRFVVRKGRRVGASTIVAPRLAVAEMLWGEHPHTPGSPPLVYAFLSVRRGEAANRLRGVKAILDILGEPYVERGDAIELTRRPAIFKVVTANYRATIGETVAFAWCDEVARWIDTESSSNPAKEVVRSLAPALATLPDACLWLVSSPLGKSDFHAKEFERGDTSSQAVDCFATWEATPLLTEEDCRALEPDPIAFAREYGAIPSDDVYDDWFGAAVDRSIDVGRRGPERILHDARYVVACDQSFQHDLFGYAAVSSEVGEWDPQLGARLQPRVTTVHEAGAWKADRSPREMARKFHTEVCRKFGTNSAFADQHSGLAFRELARDVGLRLEIVPWTGTGEESKSERFKAVRMAMYEGVFRIPDDPVLIREFRSVRSTILPSGGERIEVPRSTSGHGDRVSAIVLAGSIALARPPQLPRSRETFPERLEREANERALSAALFGA